MGVKCLRTALLLQLESVTDYGRCSTGRLERFPNENSIKWKWPFISWRWKIGIGLKGWFFWVWQNTGRQKIAQQLGRDKPKAHGEIMQQEGTCFLWVLKNGCHKRYKWKVRNCGDLWEGWLQSTTWSHRWFVENVTGNVAILVYCW